MAQRNQLRPAHRHRKEYERGILKEIDLELNPFKQFHKWFEEALSQIPLDLEPYAMTVATASKDGRPSARMLLLRDYDIRHGSNRRHGFVFYTNYESQKGRNLAENDQAALLFHWAPLERQVRIAGTVTKVSRKQSDRYFHNRPVDAQLAAWVSRQGVVIADRSVLDDRLKQIQERYDDKRVPLPPYWGGYRLSPHEFEFWQGRKSRLHDRLCYSLQPGGRWIVTRKSP